MYNEGWLHDSRELNVAVPLVLPLKLIQQGLVSCLGKAAETEKDLSMFHTIEKFRINEIHVVFSVAVLVVLRFMLI